MSPLTCPLPSPSTSRIRRLLPRLLMKLFLHHHPIGTIIDRIPSPRRRRSAIHAGRSINSIVRKITMISSASLRIKSSTRILQYPFLVGINHESEDLRNSIIVNSRSHNRQQQNIVAINGRSDDIELPPSKLFIDNGSNHNKQSTAYNLQRTISPSVAGIVQVRNVRILSIRVQSVRVVWNVRVRSVRGRSVRVRSVRVRSGRDRSLRVQSV